MNKWEEEEKKSSERKWKEVEGSGRKWKLGGW
jgi:hypothetical protein